MYMVQLSTLSTLPTLPTLLDVVYSAICYLPSCSVIPPHCAHRPLGIFFAFPPQNIGPVVDSLSPLPLIVLFKESLRYRLESS